MTATMTPVQPRAVLRQRRLPDGAAFVLLASVIVFFLAASSAPTPLYGTYQQMWGFSPIMTTIVFGTYALAVLVALLFVGRLSDHIGRRPVLLAAIAAQLPAMVLLATASGVGDLLIARVLQGLATGAAAGAVGAGLLDLSAGRGQFANSLAAPIGTASGALVAGLFVQFLPAPTHLIYLVLLGVFAVQFLGVLAMRETVTAKPGALASLRPEFGVPARARRPLFIAIPALVAGWSLAGLYGSLAPSVVHQLAHSKSLLLGGLPLFAAAGAGAVTIAVSQSRVPAQLMRFATLALAVGTGITLLGIQVESLTVFFLGSVIAGTGFGASFQASIRLVVPLAHAHERAGVLSVLYTVAYLAMGLPSVAAGWLVVNEGGLLQTTREYAGFVIVLAALAFVGLMRHERRTADALA
jgi:MFS family permease